MISSCLNARCIGWRTNRFASERRALRVALLCKEISDMRRAANTHCNGYPIFDAARRRHNSRALLYLDSRVSSEMVTPQNRLDERLGTLGNRPVRILYSGRYERVKLPMTRYGSPAFVFSEA
jgi:hypothetical protein